MLYLVTSSCAPNISYMLYIIRGRLEQGKNNLRLKSYVEPKLKNMCLVVTLSYRQKSFLLKIIQDGRENHMSPNRHKSLPCTVRTSRHKSFNHINVGCLFGVILPWVLEFWVYQVCHHNVL